MRTLCRTLCPMVCLILAGCGSKVHVDLAGEVLPIKALIYDIDGPKKAQKIKIAISSDESVNAFVLLKKHFSEAVEADLNGATRKIESKDVLAKAFDGRSHEFDIDVPAKEEITIMITSKKKTAVKVKVDSQ